MKLVDMQEVEARLAGDFVIAIMHNSQGLQLSQEMVREAVAEIATDIARKIMIKISQPYEGHNAGE